MKTRWLWIVWFAVVAPLAAQNKPAAPAAPEAGAAERAKAAGVELGTPAAGKAAKGARTKCTLTLSPNSANNGQSFSFSVGYSPCLTAPQTETFTFKWASTLANFTEATVRQKIFKTSTGCVVSSLDQTLVPTATAIKGSFTAKVVVKNTTTNAPICTASATMTVP